MKNRIMCILSIIMFSIICLSCTKNLTLEQKMVKYEEHVHKRWKYNIDSTFEGNFTDSGYREILVFFNIVHKKENAKSKETRLFVIDNNDTIVNVYTVNYRNFKVDDQNFIKEIDIFDIKYNNAVITDFNGNGMLEFIYFDWAGSTLDFYIEEFKGDRFQNIAPSILSFYELTHFDFEKKSMYLTQIQTNKKMKLTWNPERQRYFCEEY